MKKLLVLTLVQITWGACAQWVVEDPAVLAQTIINTYLAGDQLDSTRKVITQLGNAAAVKQVAGVESVLQNISQIATATPGDPQATCTGVGAMNYDGNRLYDPIGTTITTPDGTNVQRCVEFYRKFEAAQQTAANYLAVLKETESRRKAVLNGIKATTEAVQKAESLAEVQKLQAVASAQIAALNAIDGERSAALGGALVQSLNNNTDQATQEQAHLEDRSVGFKVASDKFANFLTPVSRSRVTPQAKRLSLP